MKDRHEVLLTGDESGAVSNLAVWDAGTGTCLHQYKGGTTSPATVTLAAQPDWVLSAPPGKPLLNAWQVNRSEQAPVRLFAPGPVGALSISPSGQWLAAAVEERTVVWAVGSGRQVCSLGRHYQPVTCLSWTKDSSHLISGARDGQVLVWPLVSCVGRRPLPGAEQQEAGQTAPRYSWSHHALAVTALQPGHGLAHSARLLTASQDCTVKLYALNTGALLLSVSLPSPVTAAAMDNMETVVYAGLETGAVWRVSLLDPPPATAAPADTLAGSGELSPPHPAPVTCLALSADSLSLASGGRDGALVVWDTASSQQVRTIQHRGALTHCQFLLTPAGLAEPDRWQPGSRLVPLAAGTTEEQWTCVLTRRTDLPECGDLWAEPQPGAESWQAGEEGMEQHTMDELKQINHQLYKCALKHLLKS